MSRNVIVASLMLMLMACDSSQGTSPRPPGTVEVERYSTGVGAGGVVVPNGPATKWSAEGQLVIEGHYNMGLRDGRWRYYSPSGTLLSEETWQGGALIDWRGVVVDAYGGFGYFGQRDSYDYRERAFSGTITIYYVPVLQGQDTKTGAERQRLKDAVFELADSELSTVDSNSLQPGQVLDVASKRLSHLATSGEMSKDVIKIIVINGEG